MLCYILRIMIVVEGTPIDLTLIILAGAALTPISCFICYKYAHHWVVSFILFNIGSLFMLFCFDKWLVFQYFYFFFFLIFMNISYILYLHINQVTFFSFKHNSIKFLRYKNNSGLRFLEAFFFLLSSLVLLHYIFYLICVEANNTGFGYYFSIYYFIFLILYLKNF